jgi:hypothetical protein
MSITASELRVLNQIATQTLRFGNAYECVFSRNSFVGHSPRPLTSSRPPRRSSSPVVFSASKPQPSLPLLAHLASRSDFEIYPEFRLPMSAFGPSRSHDFFIRRKIQTPSIPNENLSAMVELNRMARLVEIAEPRTKHVPIYFEPPRLSQMLSSDRVSHMVIAELLGFTKFGFAVDDFSAVFPSTSRPAIRMFSGQPRAEKDKFNELLRSKMSALRSRLGINFSPPGSLNLVASWINRLLCFKPKPLPTNKGKSSRKEKGKSSADEKTAKKNKDALPVLSLADRFITAASDTPAPVPLSGPALLTDSKPVDPLHRDEAHDLIHAVSDLRTPLRTVLARQKLSLPFTLPPLAPLLQLLSVEELQFNISSDHTSSNLFVVRPDSVTIRHVNWGPSPKDETSSIDAEFPAGNVNLVTALPPFVATLLDVMSPFTSL